MRPGGGFKQVGVSAENRCQATGPCGHVLNVCLAAGEAFLEECLGELFGPGSQRVHAAKARQPRQDVHGRGMPSKDVLFSVGSRLGAGLSEPDLAPSGVLRGFGRTTEILNGMTVMTWLPRSTECAAPGISQAKDVL